MIQTALMSLRSFCLAGCTFMYACVLTPGPGVRVRFLCLTAVPVFCSVPVRNEWTQLPCRGEAAPEELEEHSMVAHEVLVP